MSLQVTECNCVLCRATSGGEQGTRLRREAGTDSLGYRVKHLNVEELPAPTNEILAV
jgi:hypothetical protein